MIGMLNLIGGCPTRLTSHNSGWTFALLDIIKQITGYEAEPITEKNDFDKYEKIFINNGINYKEGVYNFFGGVQQGTITKLEKLKDYGGVLYCFDHDVDLSAMVNKRKELAHMSDWVFPGVQCIPTNYNERIIFGDSHSLSVYRPGFGISRNDGLTLNGFLNKYTPDHFASHTDVVLYMGNIDIRFHVHRFGGFKAVDDLTKRYTGFIDDLVEAGKRVTIHGLIPVEDESRKLPGTGQYKGQNFFGTRRERQSYVHRFNTTMSEMADYYGYKFKHWNLPSSGFDEVDNFYCMEQKQSVHLRPEYYYHGHEFIKGLGKQTNIFDVI